MATHGDKPSKHEFVQEMYESGTRAAERRAKDAEERLKEATSRFTEQFRTEHKKREEAEGKNRQLALPLFYELFDFFDFDPDNSSRDGKMTFMHKLNTKLHDGIANLHNLDHHWICSEIVDKKLHCTSYYIFQEGNKLKAHNKITIIIDGEPRDYIFTEDEHARLLGSDIYQESPSVTPALLRYIAENFFKKIEVNIHGGGQKFAAPRVMSDDEKRAISHTVGFCDALEAL